MKDAKLVDTAGHGEPKPLKCNITKDKKEDALLKKSLKEYNSITVLPAYKGRASIVLDTNSYHAQMAVMIETRPYRLLNKDPTDRLTLELSQKLLTLKHNGQLSRAIYNVNKIRPRHKQPPRIYDLPRIYNNGVLLSPIMHCVNSFAYDLFAFLANIFSS